MSAAVSFSVGIPTRNQATLLPLTLDSLLAQQRRPDEIVLSDHDSTDETPAIIADYKARYPELIVSLKPPAGSSLAMQYDFTLRSQRSEWITLLSSDDLARPGFVRTFVELATKHPQAALIRAPWENIDADGEILSSDYLMGSPIVERPPATLLSQRNGPKVSFAAFAIRRSAYLASGPIPTEIESLADWALFVQLAPFGDFIRASEVVSGYRIGHEGNRNRQRLDMWIRDELRMFTQVIPLAAERAGMRDTGWIAEASRANLRRYFATASEEFAPEERAPLVAEFTPWARSLGEEALLERFRAGEMLTDRRPIKEHLGRMARRLVYGVLQRTARR